MKGGPFFLGECNECQAQFVNTDSVPNNDMEARIAVIRTSSDGFSGSENTSLIDPDSRTPIWFEYGIQSPEDFDPNDIRNVANEILKNCLTQILSMIKDGDLESHRLNTITDEYGKGAEVSYVDLEQVDTK